MSALTDPGAVVVLPVLRCERCAGDRPHRAAPLSRSGWRCLACARTDRGSADGRLLVALALIAGALWLCYLAPILAALVFIPAAVSAGLVLALLARAERRERDDVLLRLPPLSPEALERLRRGERNL